MRFVKVPVDRTAIEDDVEEEDVEEGDEHVGSEISPSSHIESVSESDISTSDVEPEFHFKNSTSSSFPPYRRIHLNIFKAYFIVSI